MSQIKPNLLIYGDLGGSCGSCGEIDVKLDGLKCHKCDTHFKYVAFRNVKSHFPKMYKIAEERPDIVFIDYGDYEKIVGASKAEEFFK